MPSAATAPLSPADLLDQQAGDAQRYRALLHELMDMGMGMARTVHAQATAEPDGEEPASGPAAATHEAAKAFDLLSRAVRRTVALARRVAEPLPARADPARQRIVREVEDVTQWSDSDLDAEVARTLRAKAADALRAELSDRLDRAELDDEIGRRPVEDVIADIYRDLGFDRFLGNHPRAQRTPPDARELCARAAEPSAAPGNAVPASAVAYHIEPHPGPQPFMPEGGMEPRHEVRAIQHE